MARKPIVKRRKVRPDPKFGSVLLGKFIGHLMKKGKRSLAERILYGALDQVSRKTKQDPIQIFEEAIEHVTPVLEVKSKRIGGATYQIAIEVRGDRRETLAMRWILDAARGRSGASMVRRLADELIAASKKEGAAIKKREDIHRMAEGNRAFSHFA